MRRIAALVGCLVVVGCATTGEGGTHRMPGIIAHRGASAYAPENTLAAFRLADELEADWFELDCTLTRDGQVLVIHDDKVDRTTTGKGEVRTLSLEEVKRFDAGGWKDPKFAGERLPTLAEALDLAKGRIGVYIEIKNSADDEELMARILDVAKDHETLTPELWIKVRALIENSGSANLELTRKVIALVRDRHMQKKVVIQSFSPVVCAVAVAEAPEIRTEILGGDDKKKPEMWEGFLRWGYLLDVAGFNPHKEAVTPGRLAAFHAAGKTVSVWTVDDEADMRRLAEWGVDNIITNKPDLCRKVLKETPPLP